MIENYCIELKNLNVDIKSLCHNRVSEIYGNNPPRKIIERLYKEIKYAIKNEVDKSFLIAHYLAHRCKESGKHFSAMGMTGSSLLSYLLGLTDYNPMPSHYLCPNCHFFDFVSNAYCGTDLEDRSCPHCGHPLSKEGYNIPYESYWGFYGDKVPTISIAFPPDYISTAHLHLREIVVGDELSIEQVAKDIISTDPPELQLQDRFNYIALKDIPLNNATIFQFIDDGNISDFCDLRDLLMRSGLRNYKIICFADLIKASSFACRRNIEMSNNTDCFIFTREDVYLHLMNSGVPAKEAYRIMELARKGLLSTNRISGWKEMLRKYNLSTEYINTLADTHYLPPKAQAVQLALQIYRLAWLRLYGVDTSPSK